MKMNYKNFYRISAIVVFVIAGLLIIFLIWQQRTIQPVLIGREQAIQTAIQACNSSEQPREIQAELTVFKNVVGYEGNPPEPIPAWFVQMKGHFIVSGGPPLEDLSNPQPFYRDECSIFVDAKTGEALSYPNIIE